LKQTRRLTIVLVLLLAAAFVYLLGDFSQQIKKQAVYVERIANQEMALANLPEISADLDLRLAEISAASTNALQAVSNNSLNTTNILESLLILADSQQLEVTPLTADNWTQKTVGVSTYKILPVELQIQGQLSGLINFMEQINNVAKYPYLITESIAIVPTDESSITIASNNELPVTVKLSLALIVRQPDDISGDTP
jgi:hypothetical protein